MTYRGRKFKQRRRSVGFKGLARAVIFRAVQDAAAGHRNDDYAGTTLPRDTVWVAAALLDIEPRLRRVSGYKHLPLLRQALNKDLNLDNEQNARQRA